MRRNSRSDDAKNFAQAASVAPLEPPTFRPVDLYKALQNANASASPTTANSSNVFVSRNSAGRLDPMPVNFLGAGWPPNAADPAASTATMIVDGLAVLKKRLTPARVPPVETGMKITSTRRLICQ